VINLYDQVPSIYTSASRDFQYLSWLFNIVLNSVKHNVDDIYNLPNTSDPKLTELLAMTLGFKIKRNYDEKQLAALVAVIHSLLRCKGTEKAIRMAAEALVKAVGSKGEADVKFNGTDVLVTLPKDLTDITLFLDILDYILPAGMTYRVIRKNKNTETIDDIQIRHDDFVRVFVADDFKDLSELYTFDNTKELAEFPVANTKAINKDLQLNTGLLDNTIIPVLANSDVTDIDESKYTCVLCSTEEDGSNKRLLAGVDAAEAVELKAKIST
jgi:hypothetical protein